MLPAAGWLRRLAIGGCEHAPAALNLVLKEHGVCFEPRLRRREQRSPAEGTSSEHHPGLAAESEQPGPDYRVYRDVFALLVVARGDRVAALTIDEINRRGSASRRRSSHDTSGLHRRA
jgi:hypothetical protein